MDLSYLFAYRHYSICKSQMQYALKADLFYVIIYTYNINEPVLLYLYRCQKRPFHPTSLLTKSILRNANRWAEESCIIHITVAVSSTFSMMMVTNGWMPRRVSRNCMRICICRTDRKPNDKDCDRTEIIHSTHMVCVCMNDNNIIIKTTAKWDFCKS